MQTCGHEKCTHSQLSLRLCVRAHTLTAEWIHSTLIFFRLNFYSFSFRCLFIPCTYRPWCTDFNLFFCTLLSMHFPQEERVSFFVCVHLIGLTTGIMEIDECIDVKWFQKHTEQRNNGYEKSIYCCCCCCSCCRWWFFLLVRVGCLCLYFW